jgi:hypothetical protein
MDNTLPPHLAEALERARDRLRAEHHSAIPPEHRSGLVASGQVIGYEAGWEHALRAVAELLPAYSPRAAPEPGQRCLVCDEPFGGAVTAPMPLTLFTARHWRCPKDRPTEAEAGLDDAWHRGR